ncbi:hypothetical protein [Halorussus caseinilyticus]|uniref:Uncharacterized protein n=1 Tax=Halorussus caseinilyticus TaxID=3034025 RepID=A0ABD5WME9_9EURY|nr:hypothetical protein [Halorussus sp. DT72]
MTDRQQSLEPEAEKHEQMREHVETIGEELASLERLAEDCEIPALERNAAQLRGVLRTVEMNLPPRTDRDEN